MVYFIRQGEFIKIGFTESPLNRLSQLQTANPNNLEVLLIIDGDRELEVKYHELFKHHAYRGEWFFDCPEIQKHISINMQDDLRPFYGLAASSIDPSKQKLKGLRIERNMSLKQVGDLMDISKQSVMEAEDRERDGSITLKTMERYANALGYELHYEFSKKCKHIKREGESCRLNNNCTYPNCNNLTINDTER
jgi:DNA-binding XRE family transcriptional regulator